MTTVGKILVFINLVFSLVVGALVLFVYMARTNYVSELKKEQQYRQLDKSNMEAYRSQVEEVRAEKQASDAQSSATIKRMQEDLNAQQAFDKDIKEKLLAEEQKNARSDAIVKAAEAEVTRRQDEAVVNRKTLKDEIDKGIKLVKENNSYRERTTAAEIQAKTTLDINARLERQLQEMARDMARIRANAGTTTVVARNGKNPPPEAVDGVVKVADGELVKITLGSDAGLLRGHTLEVFRLNTVNPTLSKYLGTIRIIEVSATEAVGQPIGKMSVPVKAGDTVASRILGG